MVAGRPGQLFVSSGRADDYLELALPAGLDRESGLVSNLRCLRSIQNGVEIGLHVHQHSPVIVSLTALYINTPESQALPIRDRSLRILAGMQRVAPELDFGDLLPESLMASIETQPANPPAGTTDPAVNAGLAVGQSDSGAPNENAPTAGKGQSGLTIVPTEAPRPEIPVGPSVAEQMVKIREHAARGRLHKALRLLEAVLQREPDRYEAIQLRQSLKLLERREKRRQREPRNAQAHLEVGFSYLTLERDQEAAESLRQATRLDRNLFLAHLLLGIAEHRRGQLPSARDSYGRAAQLRPGDETVLDLLSALERGNRLYPWQM